MAQSLVVFKREFRSYFLSPIAYVVGGIFLVVGAWELFQFVLIEAGRNAEASMVLYFNWLPKAFVLLIPALTMRLWAEERKLGTLELLLTFPVKTSELIAGKFLGALAFVAVLLFLSLLHPITLSMYGDLDWGPVIGGYLGALLLAAAYLSLGLFVSSLTRDQITALVISVLSLALLTLFAQQWVGLLFGPTTTEFISILSPVTHFMSIGRGVIDLGDLIYYIAFCVFFLMLNGLIIETKKQVG